MRETAPQPMVSTTSRGRVPGWYCSGLATTRLTTTDEIPPSFPDSVDAVAGRAEHGHVPPHLVLVERGLLVDQVRPDGLAAQRGLHRLGHEGRVVAAALDRRSQPLGRRTGLGHDVHPTGVHRLRGTARGCRGTSQ